MPPSLDAENAHVHARQVFSPQCDLLQQNKIVEDNLCVFGTVLVVTKQKWAGSIRKSKLLWEKKQQGNLSQLLLYYFNFFQTLFQNWWLEVKTWILCNNGGTSVSELHEAWEWVC